MIKKNVAETIVETLQQAGAKRCWGIVGDTINLFTDAIRRSDIRWMHVRHEEAAGFAAGAEAYLTGEPAICAGTCGPGSLHYVNSLFESHRNGAPLVFIASDVERTEVGLNFPQEVDQRKIYEQCSVFCEYISHPDQARRITVMAAQAALTKKGVAVIVVNGDMFSQTPTDDLPWSVHQARPVLRPNQTDLQKLADKLNQANKVTIYAGIGARGAGEQVAQLAERLNAPVGQTSRAKQFVEPYTDHLVGMIGLFGNSACAAAIEDADVMLCLGTGFAWTESYPSQERVVQIDHDPSEIGKRAPVALGLVGDVGDTIEALLPLIRQKTDRQHLQTSLKRYADDLKRFDEVVEKSKGDMIHPQTVASSLNRLAKVDAIFTADVGTAMVWMLRYLQANGQRQFLTSLKHATMANGLSQAMGLAAAYPNRQVIAMCGDGGLSMLMGELLTLRQEKLPVKIVVFNNHTLGFVELEQRVEGMLDAYTELNNPDFVKLAESCGLTGYRVTQAEDLETTMQTWLNTDGAALLDVQVNRMELVMPDNVKANQMATSAMFGMKAVLGGRASELVSLVRDNWLR